MYLLMSKNMLVDIKEMFTLREVLLLMFSTSTTRTNIKYRCVSVFGVKPCHDKDTHKLCKSLLEFRKTSKCKIIINYTKY